MPSHQRASRELQNFWIESVELVLYKCMRMYVHTYEV